MVPSKPPSHASAKAPGLSCNRIAADLVIPDGRPQATPSHTCPCSLPTCPQGAADRWSMCCLYAVFCGHPPRNFLYCLATPTAVPRHLTTLDGETRQVGSRKAMRLSPAASCLAHTSAPNQPCALTHLVNLRSKSGLCHCHLYGQVASTRAGTARVCRAQKLQMSVGQRGCKERVVAAQTFNPSTGEPEAG